MSSLQELSGTVGKNSKTGESQGGRTRDRNFWLWPLPPRGSLPPLKGFSRSLSVISAMASSSDLATPSESLLSILALHMVVMVLVKGLIVVGLTETLQSVIHCEEDSRTVCSRFIGGKKSTLWDICSGSGLWDSLDRLGTTASGQLKQPPKQKLQPRVSTTALQETLSSYTPQHGSERTIREKWVIIPVAVSIIVATILGVLIFLRASKSARKGEYSVGQTRPCRLYATLLSKSIKTNWDPCDNFYSYVCDGWDRKQKESVYWTHVMDYSGQLSDSLTDSTVPSFNQSAVEKAIKIYMSCRRASAGGPGQIDEFRKLWSDCEIYWPRPTENANIFKTLIALYNTFQKENVLNFIIPRPEDSSYLHMFLGNQLSVLYNMSVRIKAAAGYQDYYESVQRMLITDRTKDIELLPYKASFKMLWRLCGLFSDKTLFAGRVRDGSRNWDQRRTLVTGAH
ncbi:uncharacterized protein LOC135400669 [Ornithodoros turicata]|uniref:uncharacterized protein LOC135400669 n=1 Tax=Ornithodoros turicata TaxID=34597 RepID=UPI003139DCD2